MPSTETSRDIAPSCIDLNELGSTLETLAEDMRALWATALDRGDFAEITKLAEASHAVHRAVVALSV